jgi:hypothetical protein
MREIVDGQQRLRAILDYIEGKFCILRVHNPEFAGCTFADLPENIQREFLVYKLPVAVLEGVGDAEVLRIFARLNTYTIPLNKQEMRNAEFFGAFKQTVYDLAFEHLAFWRNNHILTDQNIARMSDAELTSELVVSMIDGIRTTKDKDLREYYKKFDDDFPAAGSVQQQFRQTMDTIGRVFGNSLAQTPFRRLPLFYSLFCVTFDGLVGLPHSSYPRLSFSKRECELVFKALSSLGAIIQSKKPPPEYSPLIEATRLSTADVGKRRLRHEHLWQAIRNALAA